MPRSAAIFEKKKRVLHQKCQFPCKKQDTEAILAAELWHKSLKSYILFHSRTD